MKTSDIPHLRQGPMPESTHPSKSSTSSHASPHVSPKATAPSLGNAAESSDAAVQNLLAERESCRLNDDADGMKDVDGRLADLGYSAG